MWTRIRNLLIGIASTLNVKGFDAATVRAAVSAALERLLDAAKVTPSVWDDLVAAAALQMVRDDAVWSTVYEWLRRLLPAAGACVPELTGLTDDDLESHLTGICNALAPPATA